MKTIATLFREPLAQFLLLGALIFVVNDYVLDNADDPRRIVVDEARRDELTQIFQDNQGREPSAAELNDMIVRWSQNEVLYREAQRMGLDQGDDMIRNRLILKIRNVLFSNIVTSPPTDDELKTWFEDNRARYDRPARYDFEQFPVADAATAAALAARLKASDGAPPGYAGAVRRYQRRPPGNLSTAFGQQDSQQLIDVGDNRWLAVSSDKGWHLARITHRYPAEPAAFEDVRLQVKADWKTAAERADLARALKDIRDQYQVTLDFDNSLSPATSEAEAAVLVEDNRRAGQEG